MARWTGNLFSEGNVTKLVKKFPLEHTCNHYCGFFELAKLLPKEMVDEVKEVVQGDVQTNDQD
jgi:hypothetical protein